MLQPFHPWGFNLAGVPVQGNKDIPREMFLEELFVEEKTGNNLHTHP